MSWICGSLAAVRVVCAGLCLGVLSATVAVATEQSGSDCVGVQVTVAYGAGAHSAVYLPAAGYVPRLNSASHRTSKIILRLPTAAEYLVTVNGVQHRVQGTQFELTTSTACRRGTIVTLGIRRVRNFEQRLVAGVQHTHKGVSADLEVLFESLFLQPESGVSGQTPAKSTTLHGGQVQFHLTGGQILEFAVH